MLPGLRAWLVAIAMLSGSGKVLADSAPSVNDAGAARCTGFVAENFATLPDAPTQITSAEVVAASGRIPAHCRLQGYVSPQVGFEMALPLSQWNGKFLEAGCGSFCGIIIRQACNDPLRRGYACITSDQGHKSSVSDATWAYDNPQAEVDFAYRAAHVTALAGKAIVDRYYGRQPAYSYFMGCSGGGRQGLVQAQKFPEDFHGIVAGAPAIRFSNVFLNMAWNVRALMDERGAPMLRPSQFQRLHSAALAKCDMDDGIKDGVIGNPQACHVDVDALSCAAAAGPDCLNESQVAAVKRLYGGISGAPGGEHFMPGSELNWGSYQRTAAGASYREQQATNFFRYLAFVPDAGPQWRIEQLDFSKDPARMQSMQALLSDSDPDLRKFQALGGKLLMYQGWNDEAKMPGSAVDYYESVQKLLGGRERVEDFYRLFVIPGMQHCSGGDGAFGIDYLSYLESWVERGDAPRQMIGAHGDFPGIPFYEFPLDERLIEFTRPVYPYPVRAIYSGRGDPKRAESFRPSGK
jgi:feruloyl esterase